MHAHMLQRRDLVAELVAALSAVALLVFALLFFEFGLVQLTSSLSLSVFGIFKARVAPSGGPPPYGPPPCCPPP